MEGIMQQSRKAAKDRKLLMIWISGARTLVYTWKQVCTGE